MKSRRGSEAESEKWKVEEQSGGPKKTIVLSDEVRAYFAEYLQRVLDLIAPPGTRTPLYILDSDWRTPIRVEDAYEWTEWRDAHAGETHFRISGGVDAHGRAFMIETTFRGVDFKGGAELFMNVICVNGKCDDDLRTYPTREEAEADHERIVYMMKKNWELPKRWN
jgi:hypothetical protein